MKTVRVPQFKKCALKARKRFGKFAAQTTKCKSPSGPVNYFKKCALKARNWIATKRMRFTKPISNPPSPIRSCINRVSSRTRTPKPSPSVSDRHASLCHVHMNQHALSGHHEHAEKRRLRHRSASEPGRRPTTSAILIRTAVDGATSHIFNSPAIGSMSIGRTSLDPPISPSSRPDSPSSMSIDRVQLDLSDPLILPFSSLDSRISPSSSLDSLVSPSSSLDSLVSSYCSSVLIPGRFPTTSSISNPSSRSFSPMSIDTATLVSINNPQALNSPAISFNAHGNIDVQAARIHQKKRCISVSAHETQDEQSFKRFRSASEPRELFARHVPLPKRRPSAHDQVDERAYKRHRLTVSPCTPDCKDVSA